VACHVIVAVESECYTYTAVTPTSISHEERIAEALDSMKIKTIFEWTSITTTTHSTDQKIVMQILLASEHEKLLFFLTVFNRSNVSNAADKHMRFLFTLENLLCLCFGTCN
jgi:hypothetical protein